MSPIPRTPVVLLLMVAISAATAASAAARPWPGDPVPDSLPASVIDQGTTGASPLWLFLLVAAATGLVVGAAAYVAGSRRRDVEQPGEAPSLEVSNVALG